MLKKFKLTDKWTDFYHYSGVGLFYLVTFLILILNAVNASADFQYTVDQKNKDWTDYHEMYLHRIDLREMLIEVYDEDDDSTSLEAMDEDFLQDFAAEFHLRLKRSLKNIIELKDSPEVDKSERAYVAEFKISANFIKEDRNILMVILRQKKKVATVPIHFECVIKDNQSNNNIVTFSDTKDIQLINQANPFESESDFEQISRVFDFWSRSIARVISDMNESK